MNYVATFLKPNSSARNSDLFQQYSNRLCTNLVKPIFYDFLFTETEYSNSIYSISLFKLIHNVFLSYRKSWKIRTWTALRQWFIQDMYVIRWSFKPTLSRLQKDFAFFKYTFRLILWAMNQTNSNRNVSWMIQAVLIFTIACLEKLGGQVCWRLSLMHGLIMYHHSSAEFLTAILPNETTHRLPMCFVVTLIWWTL